MSGGREHRPVLNNLSYSRHSPAPLLSSQGICSAPVPAGIPVAQLDQGHAVNQLVFSPIKIKLKNLKKKNE